MPHRLLAAPALILLALSTLPVRADTLFGLHAGAQAWASSADGGFSSNGSPVDFDLGDAARGSLHVALEHPIPLLPNIKAAWTRMDTDGAAVLAGAYDFGGTTFPVSSGVEGSAEVTQVDAILYYEVLDTDTLSVDLGLDLKWLDGTLQVDGAGRSASEAFTGVAPMLYGRVATRLPFSGFGVAGEGSWVGYDGDRLHDVQAMLTWDVVDSLAVDVQLQFGWRSIDLSLEQIDGINADLEFTGAFAGLKVHF